MCRSLSGQHGGITLARQVFPGSQHYIVFNSCNLVRGLRRLQPLSLTQELNVSTPSGSAPNPQSSLSSIVSHFPLGLTRDVRTQTVSLCSVPSTHHATTADASTELSISEFLQLCFTKHPFRRTVSLRLHEDLREAQTPSHTGNSMEVTFADAATQLSFAEFFDRCILSRALPPRPQPSPTLLQDAAARASPHSAAFADASTQLPLTEFFLGCVYSNDSLDRQLSLPSHGNLETPHFSIPQAHGCHSQFRQFQWW